MSLLPDTDRILLGPGPSVTEPRVMRAMAAPTVGCLDPVMFRMLDDVRERLTRLFGAADGSIALAVSGTGTSGMETVVSNLVREGMHATVIVTGVPGPQLLLLIPGVALLVALSIAFWFIWARVRMKRNSGA